MIERKFISQRMKEFQIQEFVSSTLRNVGHSSTKMQKTPLGEKIIINASRPGLIVGRRGQSIKHLTGVLKKKFNLENPQIEINEVENPNLDANIIAERIADSLEKFGIRKFKAICHKVMTDVIGAGALGLELIISGKIPSSRAKSWRFYSGYLKKCGDASLVNVRYSQSTAKLKTGIIGVKVSIMPPNVRLPDDIEMLEEKETVVEELKEEKTAETGEKKESKEEAKEPEKKEAKKSSKKEAKAKDENKGN